MFLRGTKDKLEECKTLSVLRIFFKDFVKFPDNKIDKTTSIESINPLAMTKFVRIDQTTNTMRKSRKQI